MSGQGDELLGLVLKCADRKLLVPRSALCEVIDYADPEPMVHAPEWLLGRVRWSGKPVPLLAFEALAGAAMPAVGSRTRVAVLTAIGGSLSPPCFALLVQEHPSPVRFAADALQPAETPAAECVHAAAMLDGEPVQIPDLEQIEHQIAAIRGVSS